MSDDLIGARVRRREDPRLLQGRGRFVDDLPSGQSLCAAFVRSDIAHGRVRSVDVTEALAVDGVVGALTANDLAGVVRPLHVETRAAGYQATTWPVLADDTVRFVGEPLAIVLADSRYTAEDGVDAVHLDIEPLPAVTSIETARAPGAQLVHTDVPDNLYTHAQSEVGAVDAAFDAANEVVSLELTNQRCVPLALEGRAVRAEWEGDGSGLTVWVSHQAPHIYRTGLSRFLGVPESSIRVISPDVGGGFGGKLIVYPEDLAVAAAARLVGRPVRWTADRREDLLTTMHGREQRHRVEAAVRRDGRILALRATVEADNGAYAVWPFTAALDSGQASQNLTGPYDIPAYARDVYAVVTNKTPMGPYRGVGRVMACFSVERLVDEVARRLGMDPLEVRRRNVIRSYPHSTAAGLTIESGSIAESLDVMAAALDLDRLRAEHEALRAQGTYRGVGLAAVIEQTAYGPETLAARGSDMVLGMETATVRLEPDGTATVLVGTHSHGQGHETTFAQLVADRLGMALDDVRVRFGDTAVVPYGIGTWASRSTVYVAGAAGLACTDVLAKARAVAAHRLEIAPADLEHVGGAFVVRGDPDRRVTLAEVARVANHRPHELPDDLDPGLEASRRYRAPEPGTFSNSLHAAVVELHADSGFVEIIDYVVVEDCGPMINPTVVEGQLIGGVAQGVGQALLERFVYDGAGNPLTTTLMDYLAPTFTDVPRVTVHHLETPSPHSTGGFKGMGEGGAINAPAAVANAVADALSPFGATVQRTPLRPDWILEAMRSGREPSAP